MTYKQLAALGTNFVIPASAVLNTDGNKQFLIIIRAGGATKAFNERSFTKDIEVDLEITADVTVKATLNTEVDSDTEVSVTLKSASGEATLVPYAAPEYVQDRYASGSSKLTIGELNADRRRIDANLAYLDDEIKRVGQKDIIIRRVIYKAVDRATFVAAEGSSGSVSYNDTTTSVEIGDVGTLTLATTTFKATGDDANPRDITEWNSITPELADATTQEVIARVIDIRIERDKVVYTIGAEEESIAEHGITIAELYDKSSPEYAAVKAIFGDEEQLILDSAQSAAASAMAAERDRKVIYNAANEIKIGNAATINANSGTTQKLAFIDPTDDELELNTDGHLEAKEALTDVTLIIKGFALASGSGGNLRVFEISRLAGQESRKNSNAITDLSASPRDISYKLPNYAVGDKLEQLDLVVNSFVAGKGYSYTSLELHHGESDEIPVLPEDAEDVPSTASGYGKTLADFTLKSKEYASTAAGAASIASTASGEAKAEAEAALEQAEDAEEAAERAEKAAEKAENLADILPTDEICFGLEGGGSGVTIRKDIVISADVTLDAVVPQLTGIDNALVQSINPITWEGFTLLGLKAKKPIKVSGHIKGVTSSTGGIPSDANPTMFITKKGSSNLVLVTKSGATISNTDGFTSGVGADSIAVFGFRFDNNSIVSGTDDSILLQEGDSIAFIIGAGQGTIKAGTTLTYIINCEDIEVSSSAAISLTGDDVTQDDEGNYCIPTIRGKDSEVPGPRGAGSTVMPLFATFSLGEHRISGGSLATSKRTSVRLQSGIADASIRKVRSTQTGLVRAIADVQYFHGETGETFRTTDAQDRTTDNPSPGPIDFLEKPQDANTLADDEEIYVLWVEIPDETIDRAAETVASVEARIQALAPFTRRGKTGAVGEDTQEALDNFVADRTSPYHWSGLYKHADIDLASQAVTTDSSATPLTINLLPATRIQRDGEDVLIKAGREFVTRYGGDITFTLGSNNLTLTSKIRTTHTLHLENGRTISFDHERDISMRESKNQDTTLLLGAFESVSMVDEDTTYTDGNGVEHTLKSRGITNALIEQTPVTIKVDLIVTADKNSTLAAIKGENLQIWYYQLADGLTIRDGKGATGGSVESWYRATSDDLQGLSLSSLIVLDSKGEVDRARTTITNWENTPPQVGTGQRLWRISFFNKPSENEGLAQKSVAFNAVPITGEKGEAGRSVDPSLEARVDALEADDSPRIDPDALHYVEKIPRHIEGAISKDKTTTFTGFNTRTNVHSEVLLDGDGFGNFNGDSFTASSRDVGGVSFPCIAPKKSGSLTLTVEGSTSHTTGTGFIKLLEPARGLTFVTEDATINNGMFTSTFTYDIPASHISASLCYTLQFAATATNISVTINDGITITLDPTQLSNLVYLEEDTPDTERPYAENIGTPDFNTSDKRYPEGWGRPENAGYLQGTYQWRKLAKKGSVVVEEFAASAGVIEASEGHAKGNPEIDAGKIGVNPHGRAMSRFKFDHTGGIDAAFAEIDIKKELYHDTLRDINMKAWFESGGDAEATKETVDLTVVRTNHLIFSSDIPVVFENDDFRVIASTDSTTDGYLAIEAKKALTNFSLVAKNFNMTAPGSNALALYMNAYKNGGFDSSVQGSGNYAVERYTRNTNVDITATFPSVAVGDELTFDFGVNEVRSGNEFSIAGISGTASLQVGGVTIVFGARGTSGTHPDDYDPTNEDRDITITAEAPDGTTAPITGLSPLEDSEYMMGDTTMLRLKSSVSNHETFREKLVDGVKLTPTLDSFHVFGPYDHGWDGLDIYKSQADKEAQRQIVELQLEVSANELAIADLSQRLNAGLVFNSDKLVDPTTGVLTAEDTTDFSTNIDIGSNQTIARPNLGDLDNTPLWITHSTGGDAGGGVEGGRLVLLKDAKVKFEISIQHDETLTLGTGSIDVLYKPVGSNSRQTLFTTNLSNLGLTLNDAGTSGYVTIGEADLSVGDTVDSLYVYTVNSIAADKFSASWRITATGSALPEQYHLNKKQFVKTALADIPMTPGTYKLNTYDYDGDGAVDANESDRAVADFASRTVDGKEYIGYCEEDFDPAITNKLGDIVHSPFDGFVGIYLEVEADGNSGYINVIMKRGLYDHLERQNVVPGTNVSLTTNGILFMVLTNVGASPSATNPKRNSSHEFEIDRYNRVVRNNVEYQRARGHLPTADSVNAWKNLLNTGSNIPNRLTAQFKVYRGTSHDATLGVSKMRWHTDLQNKDYQRIETADDLLKDKLNELIDAFNAAESNSIEKL